MKGHYSKQRPIEHPRLVSIETTNFCNAKCPFCPNAFLSRPRMHMSDDLFEKILKDCQDFSLEAIEPFLNGEPFSDPKILFRLEMINLKLSQTKLRLYTNGYALTPEKIDHLMQLRIDHLYISLNTINPDLYRKMTGLELEKTLDNLRYLLDPVRKQKVARRITLRTTRTEDISLLEQNAIKRFCKIYDVRCFIVGAFNYKGDIPYLSPIPSYPCENITRVDVLADGVVSLCCMDQEGEYSWGDIKAESVLQVFNSKRARYYRRMHREGKRKAIEPCKDCNLFWYSLDHMPALRTAKFAAQMAWYFLRYRPIGRQKPGVH
jgi:radical SAM protein with 4Fe4S-binding SPASM domain